MAAGARGSDQHEFIDKIAFLIRRQHETAHLHICRDGCGCGSVYAAQILKAECLCCGQGVNAAYAGKADGDSGN
ncbi:MAG: hypothetical protein Rhirs2KO_14470 [Rhizobiaceae bacterium]